MGQMANGFDSKGVKSQHMGLVKSTGVGSDGGYEMANVLVGMSDMRDLEELLSKLNPLAEEFVPPSLANNHGYFGASGVGYANNVVLTNFGNANGLMSRRVVDCRVCGDPNSILRFAFIEFTDEGIIVIHSWIYALLYQINCNVLTEGARAAFHQSTQHFLPRVRLHIMLVIVPLFK
ncbi:polyadenylate-binding protein-interacting protein 12 [Quercus suber]|uniref:Polyadenylate-binding protein-interacting protein 12 n=1 Tax=Quercus suber TaxID=58331 RepID=A0AAW0LCK6_QUESU